MNTGFAIAGILTATLLATPTAFAGPVVDAAAKAEALADEGKRLDAVLALDAVVARLWDKVQLTFVETLFVSDRPKSYGVYNPRPNSIFKPGEDMTIYAEFIGYEFGRDGDYFTIGLKADTEVKSEAGKLIGGQKEFLTLSHRSRVPAREFFAVITYSFSGLAPGKYVVTTKLNDQNSDQWASFDLPFEIE